MEIPLPILSILTPTQQDCYALACPWLQNSITTAVELHKEGHVVQEIVFSCLPRNDYHAHVNSGIVTVPPDATKPVYEMQIVQAELACVAREHKHVVVLGKPLLMQTHG